MKRIIFILLMILVMDTAIFAQGKNYIKYETEHPSICVEINNKKLNFLIDTGSPKSLLFKKSFTILELEKEEWFQEFKNSVPNVDEIKKALEVYSAELKTLGVENVEQEKIKPQKGFEVTCPNTKIASKLINLKLRYEERFDKVSKYIDYDGILGMDVLYNFENLIIDYKNKKIYFDSKLKIKKDLTNLYSVSEKNKTLKIRGEQFCIKTKINNQDMDAILDTGNLTGAIVIPEPILQLDKEKPVNTNNIAFCFCVDLEIGSRKFEKVKATFSNNPEIKTIYKINKLGVSEANIGHEFFKDKIIQFDFKNKTFGIK